MGKQEDFVLRALEERDVRFVRLWFTDVLGFLKSVAVAPAELEGAFAEGIGFDGSAIEGFARVYESDMLAKPDPATFQILPWRGEGPTTARMFCDIVMPDGSPVVRRPALRPQAHPGRRPPTRGSPSTPTPRSSSTCSRTRRSDGVEPVPVDRSGYFDHTAQSKGADFRREAITMLEAMGISVEFSHHEGGPGQQEIDLRYADALSTADNIMTFRTVIREVALSQGIWATFMPKPFTSHPGSGMHTHVSLFEGDQNAFYEAGSEYQLSKVGRQFIAGVLAHAQEISVVTNQWVNSYKRMMFGGEAPSYVCWGHNNRSAMIRVPMYKPLKGQSTRIELRTVDAACNPYLAFAVVLAAGMKGIEQGLDLPREAEDDVWSLTERERTSLGHRAAAQEPQRGDRDRRALRAARRDPRRARLRLLPPQQARRVGRVPRPGLRLRARPDAAGPLGDGTMAGLQPRPGQPAAPGARAIVVASARAHRCPRGVHPGDGRRTGPRGVRDGRRRAAARRRRALRSGCSATPGARPRSPRS